MAGTRGAAWITATLLLALLLLAASTLAAAGRLEARAGSLLGGVAGAVDAAVRPVSEFVLSAGELRALADENARLKGELARLSSEVAALREERAASIQVEELLTAVEAAGLLPESADAPGRTPRVVSASVLARDPSPTRAELLIDRGRAHGVYVGQPVLGPAATLIGIIADADERSARVRLLIDVRSAVTSVVQGSRTPAALAGTAQGLRLEFVAPGAPVSVGDAVITSALGGRLPAGLLAGRIAAIHTEPHDLFATIEVEPLVDYNRLEQLLVLTDALPSALAGEASR
ncbi:MAG: rod shape-determining protein MreC [Chloroflexi bacterium]|nr:rod shape-determining protein MreC [Chloroflexota bacterium]